MPMSPGKQLADFVYIDDVVQAYLRAEILLQQRPKSVCGRRFAAGTGRHLSFRDIVRIYEKVSGRPLNAVWEGRPYRPREVMVPWRGKSLPGWKADVGFEEGLRRTLAEDQPL